MSLSKLSSPRWVKELLQNEGIAGKIQYGMNTGTVPKAERVLKRLGSGSSQDADLVMNPRHGLSVKKTKKDYFKPKKEAEYGYPKIRNIGAEEDRDLTQILKTKRPGFAQILDVKGRGTDKERMYQEYIKGSSSPLKDKLSNMYRINREASDSFRKNKTTATHNRMMTSGRLVTALKQKMNGNLVGQENRMFGDSTKKSIEEIKTLLERKGKILYDHASNRNIINGTIVDASAMEGKMLSRTQQKKEGFSVLGRKALY